MPPQSLPKCSFRLNPQYLRSPHSGQLLEGFSLYVVSNTYLYDYLNVNCKDYLIDVKTNKVIRGNENKINDYLYELAFQVSMEDDLSIKNCPNCSAPIESNVVTYNCEYCGSTVVRKSNKMVLYGKKMIRQS